MKGRRILIVDDEEAVRFGVRGFLESRGFEVVEAASCDAAHAVLQSAPLDAAVVDWRLPDGTALDLLPRLKQVGVPVVILTAHGSIELAVRAIKEGAEQFLTKPIELQALAVVIERLIENDRLRRRQHAGRPAHGAERELDPFLGSSPSVRRLADEARKILAADRPLLIRGETGTGKGVLARWLHRNGPRADEAFVDLNCAGLPREFVETELFGHEKGAFTGAAARKVGLLEIAHRGTLFLDEIGDMEPAVQAKLLKVLEEKRFRRLGGVHDQWVDLRLIAATHQDLAELIRERRFREDLYYRISAIPLDVAPLRERPEDIPALAASILRDLAAELGRRLRTLSAEGEAALRRHAWPGNVRELRNVLERAALLEEAQVLGPAELRLPDAARLAAGPADTADLTLSEVQRRHIVRVLEQEGGHVARAAERLGIPRSSLYQKLKALGLLPPRRAD